MGCWVLSLGWCACHWQPFSDLDYCMASTQHGDLRWGQPPLLIATRVQGFWVLCASPQEGGSSPIAGVRRQVSVCPCVAFACGMTGQKGRHPEACSLYCCTACTAGAKRHYTMSYSDFYSRLRGDPYFAAWYVVTVSCVRVQLIEVRYAMPSWTIAFAAPVPHPRRCSVPLLPV